MAPAVRAAPRCAAARPAGGHPRHRRAAGVDHVGSASTCMPPAPSTTTGPNCSSWTMPSSISTPLRGDHRRDQHARPDAASRDRGRRRAARFVAQVEPHALESRLVVDAAHRGLEHHRKPESRAAARRRRFAFDDAAGSPAAAVAQQLEGVVLVELVPSARRARQPSSAARRQHGAACCARAGRDGRAAFHAAQERCHAVEHRESLARRCDDRGSAPVPWRLATRNAGLPEAACPARR